MKTYYINPNKRQMNTSLQAYENTILPLFPHGTMAIHGNPWRSMDHAWPKSEAFFLVLLRRLGR
jgi:hypothetical protein